MRCCCHRQEYLAVRDTVSLAPVFETGLFSLAPSHDDLLLMPLQFHMPFTNAAPLAKGVASC